MFNSILLILYEGPLPTSSYSQFYIFRFKFLYCSAYLLLRRTMLGGIIPELNEPCSFQYIMSERTRRPLGFHD